MEFDWTTFALEIANFLILVWLLRRFLYRPVAAALARRRAELERSANEARAREEAAAALKSQYEGRLAEWEREKERAQASLRESLEAERSRRMAEIESSVGRERVEALERHEAERVRRELEQAALGQGAGFASRLLAALAGPELEARIVDLALAELRELPEERRAELRAAAAAGSGATVRSAFELAEARRREIAKGLGLASGAAVACEFRCDESLLAGLRIELGPWVLGADLRDELAAFAESGRVLS